MAQIIRYVDPDATGTPINGQNWDQAYRSLSAWTAAEATNLVTAGNYHTVYCRSSGGTADTTACNITRTWVTDAANYLEIIGADFPSNGVVDTSKYRLAVTNAFALTIRPDFVYVHNLQILVTTSGTGNGFGIYMRDQGTSNVCIDSCIVKGICSGTGSAWGIYFQDTTLTTYIYNTLIYDFNAAGGGGGLYSQYLANAYLYNCTAYNCVVGFSRASGALYAKNCAVGNCGDDFVYAHSFSIEYCCSDDGDGTNAQNPSGGNWANEFNNIGGEDFSLKAGGNCIGKGTDDPGVGLYSDDIIGTARSSTWDIGAFEYLAPPVTERPMIYLFDLP